VYRRLFLKYANTPLLATTTLVNNTVSLLLADKTQLEPNALSTKEGKTYADLFEIRGSIGILNITGPIFRYGKVEACDTVYGTQHFSEILANFEKNHEIEQVVIQFNTGGGEASGISELAEQIKGMGKPTTAYVDGNCASAGYWLASACDKIVANDTALVGSIGVVFAFLDTSKMEEQMGIESIEVYSNVSPHKRVDVKSDDGRARVQTLADDLAEIFVAKVATYRDVTPAYVKENFGKGGVMIASKALEAKMIDEIGTFEALITNLQGEQPMQKKPNPNGASASTSATEANQATATAMTAEAFKEANPTAYQEIFVAGATAERERIQAIASIDAPHYQGVIEEHMFNGSSTVNDVKVALFDAEKANLADAQASFYKGGKIAAEALKNISTTHADGGGTTKAENPLMADVKKKNEGVK